MAGDEPGDDNTTKHQWFLLLLQVPGSHQSDKKQNEDSIRVKKVKRALAINKRPEWMKGTFPTEKSTNYR